jgi:hypothetical protein
MFLPAAVVDAFKAPWTSPEWLLPATLRGRWNPAGLRDAEGGPFSSGLLPRFVLFIAWWAWAASMEPKSFAGLSRLN